MDDQKLLSEIEKLKELLHSKDIPANLSEKVDDHLARVRWAIRAGNFFQIDIAIKYLSWLARLPWNNRSEDILDINRARAILDKNHFGLEKVKKRVLEFLAVLILHKQKNLVQLHGSSLFFVGLAGTGKTTFASSIAEVLGRRFVRIPFGGLSSAFDLRGQSKTFPEAEPGLVIKALARAGVKNPVILLDELDRITPESRAAVMGVLVELLDPNQNNAFVDYFIDYPFDLSEVIFIATANNTNNIATAVLDRLELVQMPSYTDEEKIHIAKDYLLPKKIEEAGLSKDNLIVKDDLWPKITRPFGFDPGIRSLERTIETLVRRVALKIVEGQGNKFIIDEGNYKEYLN